LKRCREPFYSSKHKQDGEGLGLGLSIVESLVSEAGGRLELNSTEGEGTEIKITLPAA
jgi:signal transduction histidine kinase